MPNKMNMPHYYIFLKMFKIEIQSLKTAKYQMLYLLAFINLLYMAQMFQRKSKQNIPQVFSLSSHNQRNKYRLINNICIEQNHSF